MNELFIFEPLVYKFMEKTFFIYSNGWNMRKRTIKKKDNIHLTARLTQLEVLWSYWQSDISRPPSFWKSIYLSLEMSERNISLRVYLKMMYFLSVIGMGGSSVYVEGVSFGWAFYVCANLSFICATIHLRQFYVCANKFSEF